METWHVKRNRSFDSLDSHQSLLVSLVAASDVTVGGGAPWLVGGATGRWYGVRIAFHRPEKWVSSVEGLGWPCPSGLLLASLRSQF